MPTCRHDSVTPCESKAPVNVVQVEYVTISNDWNGHIRPGRTKHAVFTSTRISQTNADVLANKLVNRVHDIQDGQQTF